ncbi:hypothetical protein [Flavobacterium pallidum]|uniref:Uncharacterized protein n=1 Tax=Flavobacterium pallidum TaxID=2172098 RepID=A0A2S1SFV9_9FLAO|nr:hypothetical protein [Flavobacterium pallidum]AWI25280.1 hypothetical protein HYN49_04860 [Flavobacterium pallidum]
MNSKKSIYILLPVVIGIWGLIVYQLFNYGDADNVTDKMPELTLRPLPVMKKNAILIDINPRDPFLGKILSADNGRAAHTGGFKKKTASQGLQWPEVRYKGIVSDVKEKTKVYMLTIDGATFLMKKGIQEKGITIKDGDRKTVKIIFNGVQKVISIQP